VRPRDGTQSGIQKESQGHIAILAGGGSLPPLLVRSLEARGEKPLVLAFRGFCDPHLARQADEKVDLLDIEKITRILQNWKPRAVTMAGAVRRPQASALLSAFSYWRNRHDLAALIARGDDQLLRGAVTLLEEKGFSVLGVKDLAPNLLASKNLCGKIKPDNKHIKALKHGFNILNDVSVYDIGQSCVVSGERVLAIEGPEGTDAMLKRVLRLKRRYPFERMVPDGVLVKTSKKGQDMRVDIPAIGPRTVIMAHKAGLAGIAVGAGETLILEEAKTLELADHLGLFILTMPELVMSGSST
jgi:UDP-2,3-diacylglucosamine hydrolase